jgi:putative serine protease PepD
VLIRARPLLAALGVALLSALVASGVTLAVLRIESRTNPQSVDIRPGATISEDSAIIQAAARAKPAVVSIVTQQQPQLVAGSGYLVTSDGYIVTSIDVIAGSTQLTVLVPGDAKLHDARLIDYDCQTAVAVLKIDQVSGLPTLAFGDPAAVVTGQPLVAVAGPLRGGAVTRGIVRALHLPVTIADPTSPDKSIQISDTIETDAAIDGDTAGGPLLNVAGQVIGVAMAAEPGTSSYGLNTADIQDDVQQILQAGTVTIPWLGATTTDMSAQVAALQNLPQGSLIESVAPGSPAANAGLQQGDVITALDEVQLDAAHPLTLLLRSQFHIDQRVTVTYTRGGASSQVQLTLSGQHPTCG